MDTETCMINGRISCVSQQRRTYDLKWADDVGMVQQADDIHAALGLHLEIAGSAGAHALVPHQGALAQQLHSIQVHVRAVQHQLHFAEGPLAQGAHNDVLVHKGDALQHSLA